MALLASFMGICKVKDDNIVQAMQQAQADKLDHWAFYQARNLREELAKATVVQLRLQSGDRPTERKADYDQAIAQYEKLAAEQAAKKDERGPWPRLTSRTTIRSISATTSSTFRTLASRSPFHCWRSSR
ncbi:MAG: DUF4337 family protein [Ramlibacter sp.]